MIWHGEHIAETLQRDLLSAARPVVWVSTQKVWNLYGSLFPYADKNRVYCLPEGEEAKSLQAAEQLWKQWAHAGLTRDTLVIQMGGGALLDAAGFCSSTYMRGLEFWNIPSTLLAMVDASVGGKTALNLGSLKNYIGTFQPAQRVYISTEFLSTLPEVQLLSGWGEITKHALLAGEPLWSECQTWPQSPSEWASLLSKNTAIKKSIVDADFRDNGMRQKLNAGHSVGHALESFYRSQGTPLEHGIAIAHGLAIEALVAFRMNLISRQHGQAITTRIDQFFPHLNWETRNNEALFSYIQKDKKNASNEWRFSLPRQIGDVRFSDSVSQNTLVWALTQYQNLPR
jgi:3-dehydroquinate synthase